MTYRPRHEQEMARDALEDFTDDILMRCAIAVRNFDGHPNPAWSTGEQLAVALVLDDVAHLTSMGYSWLTAAIRVRNSMTMSYVVEGDAPETVARLVERGAVDIVSWVQQMQQLVREQGE